MQTYLYTETATTVQVLALFFIVVQQASATVEFVSGDDHHPVVYSPKEHDGVYVLDTPHGGITGISGLIGLIGIPGITAITGIPTYRQVSAALSQEDVAEAMAAYMKESEYEALPLLEFGKIVNDIIIADLIKQTGKISKSHPNSVLSLYSYIGCWKSGQFQAFPQRSIKKGYMKTVGVPKTNLFHEFQQAPGFKDRDTPLSEIKTRFANTQGMSEFKHEIHSA